MSQYVSINPRKRKRILLRAIYFSLKTISLISLLIVSPIVFLPVSQKAKIGYAHFEFYAITALVYIGSWLLLFLLFRLSLIPRLKKLNAILSWNYIEIQPSGITLYMDDKEFNVEKDNISEIGLLSESEKKFVTGNPQPEQTNLNILKIVSEDSYHYVILDTIQNSDKMLRELHEIFPVYGFEGDREKEFVNIFETLYNEILAIEEFVKDNGITEPEEIVREFNRVVSEKDDKSQKILELSNKFEELYFDPRLALQFVQAQLQMSHHLQKVGKKKPSVAFWNEILQILFKGNDTASRVWGLLNVLEEQKLHFNMKLYVNLLETYGVGPLSVTEMNEPAMAEYCIALYKHTVILLNAETAQQVVLTIINNIYQKLMIGNIESKQVYDNYFALIRKYVQMPEEMSKLIPEFNPGKCADILGEVKAFFMDLFEKLPKTYWSSSKCQFRMDKPLLTDTDDHLIRKTRAYMNV